MLGGVDFFEGCFEGVRGEAWLFLAGEARAWAAERLADGLVCLVERRTIMFVVGDALTVGGPANQSKLSGGFE